MLRTRETAALLLLMGGLVICSPASRAATQGDWSELEAQIRQRGIDPETLEIPGRVSPEMREWLRERVPESTPTDLIMPRVLAEIVNPNGLGLVYDPGFTGTAQEVWDTRRANCLGFTHLFVGLTRELGLDTYYVRWSRIERFRREGDLVVVSGHVSAGYGHRQVLEFGAVEGLEGQLARRISDLNAVARHYGNRSAEKLRAGDVPGAVEAADLATRLDPDLADAWVNLGVALRRSGNATGAEAAYRRATLVDPDHVPAYQNLSALMYLLGREDAARETLELLDRRDNRNPFTYLTLGDGSFELQRYEESARFYRRAHRLGPDLAETRAARGAVELALGDEPKARKWLRRAQAIDPEEPRTLELAEKLSRSGDSTK